MWSYFQTSEDTWDTPGPLCLETASARQAHKTIWQSDTICQAHRALWHNHDRIFLLLNTWVWTCLYIILVKLPFLSVILFRMVPTILLLVISTALAAPRGNMTEDYMEGSEDNSGNSSEGSHDYLEGAHDYMVDWWVQRTTTKSVKIAHN